MWPFMSGFCPLERHGLSPRLQLVPDFSCGGYSIGEQAVCLSCGQWMDVWVVFCLATSSHTVRMTVHSQKNLRAEC